MDIYAENILDHFHRPRHKGVIQRDDDAGADARKTGAKGRGRADLRVRAQDSNPLCGDEIEIELSVDKKGIIKDAKFCGEGCAISQASASMLMEKIIGQKVGALKKLDMKEVRKMLGVELTPVRLKCALLSLNVLKKAVNQIKK
jgi:nitrogen fixation protein NifU and related proteins